MQEQLMMEYIFFHQQSFQRFKDFLLKNDIPVLKESVDQTDIEGFTIFLADDLEDIVSEQIEEFYDQMMELDEKLVAEDAGEDNLNQVGIAVALVDGQQVLASVDPDVMNRLLTVISHDELGQFVDDIVKVVENPDLRPLCKR